MKNIRMTLIAALIIVFAVVFCSPASAVLLEEKYMGAISKLEPSYDRIIVNVASVYEGGEWVTYGKSSLKNNLVTGTTSNPSVFKDLSQGDSVEVTIMGGPGGEWITIGKIGSTGLAIKPIIACYGDPTRLVSPFYKNYEISYISESDCELCEGTICEASGASVTVKRDGLEVESADMYPGSTHVFGWDNATLQYIPLITFVSGEGESSQCSSSDVIMAGPQAVSDFTIYITQRSTIILNEVETLETEGLTEGPTSMMTAVTTPATVVQTDYQTPAPTTAATPATPGFTAICAFSAIFGAFCLVAGRLRR
ncbi:hypothetical protein [Methanolacinia paynteri]|uniref:hypothetical protein n=1 Tax=Methanolacinia paynteri TaxID=230356 RepID=UPI00064EB1AC|nr:hypothetical protein [Methanolacinia paynteri]